MTDSGKLPTSGYKFEKVYAVNLSMRVAQPATSAAAESPLLFAWDWRMIGEGPAFEVSLQLGLDPTAARNEEIRVTLVGRFSPAGEHQEVDLKSFVRFHAPAILMPFIRETIASLTGRGFFDPLVLPPLNVQRLMDQQDPMAATGAKQLAPEGIPAAR